MNVSVIFISKGTLLHPSLRGTNLVTRYGFPEGSCIILNKVTCGIRKMRVRYVSFVLLIVLYIYPPLHICPSKLSEENN